MCADLGGDLVRVPECAVVLPRHVFCKDSETREGLTATEGPASKHLTLTLGQLGSVENPVPCFQEGVQLAAGKFGRPV